VKYLVLLGLLIFVGGCVESYEAARLAPSSFFDGDCDIKDDCGGDFELLSVSAKYNGHVALDVDFYDYKLCCDINEDTSVEDCSDDVLFTYSSDENAHVGVSGYSNDFCLDEYGGDCEVRDSCEDDEICIFSVSSEENAHIGDCDSGYSEKLCCEDIGIGGGVVIDDGVECGNGIKEGTEECDGSSFVCGISYTCLDCECVPEQICDSSDECQSDSDCSGDSYCNLNSCSCVDSSCGLLDECQSDDDCVVGSCDLSSCRCRRDGNVQMSDSLGALEFFIPLLLVIFLLVVIYVYQKQKR